jgi:hypothetical protein
MKKWLCLALAASGALAVGSVSRAQTAGIEAHGLFAFGFDGEVEGVGDSDLDNGGGFGGGVVFNLSEFVKADVGGDWIRTEYKDVDKADVTLIPVTAALRVGGNLDMLYAYIGGGAGYSFNDIDVSGLKLKDAPIYFALVGSEIELGELVVLRGEFRYNWIRPDLEVTGFGDDEAEIKLDHMQFRLGLGLYF